MRRLHLASVAVTLLLLIWGSACGGAPTPAAPAAAPTATPAPAVAPTAESAPTSEATTDVENQLEQFEPSTFAQPTNIDNEWFPLQPGRQWVYEGTTEEAGVRVPHRGVLTVTDLTKVIAGVRSVVIWDVDYADGQVVETELGFFAQDTYGNVWQLGQFPEVYERGKFVDAPAWITGLQGATAGIIMKAEPKLGTPSYSQGWGPAVNWTDRGQVDQMGLQTCVPVDCYEDVLVIAEFSREEPDAFQLKYYARGVGNVRVGWRGEDATKETLELVEFAQLSPEALAEVHTQALELEKRAYEISQDVYGQTSPAQ